jgi:DNA-directed RNA polymerase specialized sigma24 family protein
MDINTVQQIERAIDALTPEQREELYLWLDEHYLQPSDIQLKAAIDAGRFDDRIARAVADHNAGRTEPL